MNIRKLSFRVRRYVLSYMLFIIMRDEIEVCFRYIEDKFKTVWHLPSIWVDFGYIPTTKNCIYSADSFGIYLLWERMNDKNKIPRFSLINKYKKYL